MKQIRKTGMSSKNIFLLYCLLSSALTAVARNDAVQTLTLDSAVANMTKQLRMLPQEKLYLQTDKPYYITGEKIFFRAHLTEAIGLAPASLSRYVYVELINPLDSAVIRVKIRPDDEQYFGHIALPEDLPEGVYRLRAYTHFMRNMDTDYFFSKLIRIGDPHALNIKTEYDFRFENDRKGIMELRFADLKNSAYLRPKTIKVRINNGDLAPVKPDKEGLARVKFNLPPDERMRMAYVELEESRTRRQFIRIPYPDNRYDVSFYPEGGCLIENRPCNIAFKSLRSDGLPAAVTGTVFDSRGAEIALLIPVHDGMGYFVIKPQAGEKYHAVCKDEKGTEMRFDLPEVQANAATLKVNISKDRFWIAAHRSDQSLQDTLYLLLHQGGLVRYANRWDNAKEYVLIHKNAFSSGIVHVLLLSSGMQIVSERLVFVQNDDQAQVAFATDKPAYKRREKVQAVAELKDRTGKPLAGTFSVSVTDNREVTVDTCRNILESLLLSSELKGTIENPAFYLKKEKKSQLALDLLMMTHGWRRYDIPNVLKGRFTTPKEPLEIGQEISGIIKGGLLARPSDKAKVSILAPKQQYVDVVETDKNGAFAFHGFEFPDSTRFVVHATSKKGRNTVELQLHREHFPPSALPWVYRLPPDDRTFLDYVSKADKKYTYENGMRLINLDEVTVTARREEPQRFSSIYGTADNSITQEEMEKFGTASIRMLLTRLPGVIVGNDHISIRGATGNPLLLVDNIEMDIEMLDDINTSDIAQIDLLKSASNLSLYGSRGGNGVIAIYTKTGEVSFRKELFNISAYTPLGYQKPAAFYAPIYDTPEKSADETPDLRTTVYWKPNVRVDETTGTANLEFYTADTETTYSVVIEGVAQNGQIIRHVSGMLRK
jgi:TonB-dependent SusC/RagA subfamily outer membrane receptor